MASVQAIAAHLRLLSAPEPLRALPGWLLWRYESFEAEPKPRKIPYYVNGTRRYGEQGGVKDRGELVTFAAARDAAVRGKYDGVGLALLPDWGITALDVDHCVDPDGKLPPEIEEIIQKTYAEYSPSGTGIRAFFTGSLGNRKSKATAERYGLETFSSSGYVTFTGNMLPYVDLLGYEDRVAPVPSSLVSLCEARFGGTTADFDPDDFMAGHEPKIGLTVEQMEELLDAIDPDCSRDEWVRVGMALHHECEGDDTGFELWNEWSSLGGKYPSEEALRQQWDSFERRKGSNRRQVTMASVIRMAKEAQASRPSAATAEELRAVASSTVAGADGFTPPSYDGRLPIVRASEVAQRPPAEWFIKGVMPKAEIGAVFGPSGSGKSFVVLDMLAHLASGLSWRDRRSRRARCLYVAAEGGTGVGKRFKAWAQHYGLDLGTLDISVMTVPPNIMLKEDIAELVRAITAAGGFDIIALDTYAQVTPGANENAAEDMGLALSHCRSLYAATLAMILLVHHSGKDASRGVRGWSGINAALDFAIEITRDEDTSYREMRLSKMKDGEDGLKFPFKLEVLEVGMDDDGDLITSCVAVPSEERTPTKAEDGRKGIKRRGRIETHILETMAIFGSADTVALAELIDRAADTLPPPEEGKRDTRRQHVTRSVYAMSKEKDGPLQVIGGQVIFYE